MCVHTGHVAIQSICTNSLFSTNMVDVYNQDPHGGSFLVDRAELREIPTLE